MIVLPLTSPAVEAVLIEPSNDADIAEVNLVVDGVAVTQTDADNGQTTTASNSVQLTSIELTDGTVLDDFTGGSIEKNADSPVVVRPDGTTSVGVYSQPSAGTELIVDYNDAGFEAAGAPVIGGRELTTYFDYGYAGAANTGGSGNIDDGDFSDWEFRVILDNCLTPQDYVLVMERNGNTAFNLIPTNAAGDVIGTDVLEFRGTDQGAGYAWNTGYSPLRFPSQELWFSVAPASLFGASENVCGFRVDNDGQADVKFFGLRTVSAELEKYVNLAGEEYPADLAVEAVAAPAGSDISFRVEYENTGTDTLLDVTFSDTDVTLSCNVIDDGSTSGILTSDLDPDDEFVEALAPGGIVECTASLTDIDPDTAPFNQGIHVNTVTVQADNSDGAPVEPWTDDAHVVIPSIDIEKATNDNDADTPTGPTIDTLDPVTWTYVVTNTGATALQNVTVIDDQLASTDIDCDSDNVIASLAIGASATCTATGIAASGQYRNLGSVVGDVPTTFPNVDPSAPLQVTDDDPSHYFGRDVPSFTIDKRVQDQPADTADTAVAVDPGTALDFSVLVTNTGNIELVDLEVTDDDFGDNFDCGDDGDNVIASIPVGDAVTCTFDLDGTRTQPDDTLFDDSFNGLALHTNTATGTYTPPTGNPITESNPANVLLNPTFSIGDFVWNDTDRDGIQDPDETGLVGATVTLFDDTGAQVGDPIVIDDTGAYLFEDLPAGDYTVEFTLPFGYTESPTGQGNGTNDSDGSTVDVTVTDADRLDIDYGGHELPAALGDFVWNDTNGDGIQDPDEPGIPGVTVTVDPNTPDDPSDDIITTTDADGFYQILDLAPGDYNVTFTPPDGPGYLAAPADQGGDDTVDNDWNGTTPVAVSLTADELNSTIDAAFLLPASVGNFVWNDLDQDGIQDPGEPGIGDVTVTIQGADGFTTTTTTANDGSYSFTDLPPGDYTITFTPPANTTPSPTAAPGSTTANDSNGITTTITLQPGEQNTTIDLGVFTPTEPTTPTTQPPPPTTQPPTDPAQPSPTAPTPPTGPPIGSLPDTGSNGTTNTIAIAALILAAGIGLHLTTRQRQRQRTGH